jgi:hypothetical protein
MKQKAALNKQAGRAVFRNRRMIACFRTPGEINQSEK